MLTGTTVSMLRRTRTTKGGGTRIEPKAQLGTALNRASVGVQQRSGNVSRTTRRSHNIPGVVRWLYRQRWSGATVSTVGSVKVTKQSWTFNRKKKKNKLPERRTRHDTKRKDHGNPIRESVIIIPPPPPGLHSVTICFHSINHPLSWCLWLSE